MGLPVVTTDCGGPRDYVIEGITGFIVGIGDAPLMAAKILKLLTNEKLRQKMGAQGKAFVTHFFAEAKIFNIFRAAMQQVWPDLRGLPLMHPMP
jgi:glycosyltransferase involved in cell wall biosynthesis